MGELVAGSSAELLRIERLPTPRNHHEVRDFGPLHSRHSTRTVSPGTASWQIHKLTCKSLRCASQPARACQHTSHKRTQDSRPVLGRTPTITVIVAKLISIDVEHPLQRKPPATLHLMSRTSPPPPPLSPAAQSLNYLASGGERGLAVRPRICASARSVGGMT